MKYFQVFFLLMFSNFVHAAAEFPIFFTNLEVVRIEAWPNAENPTYGFTVYIDSSLTATGCGSASAFSVLAGDYQDESYSLLLAAMISGKKIRVRVAECSDRPLVDRVSILK